MNHVNRSRTVMQQKSFDTKDTKGTKEHVFGNYD